MLPAGPGFLAPHLIYQLTGLAQDIVFLPTGTVEELLNQVEIGGDALFIHGEGQSRGIVAILTCAWKWNTEDTEGFGVYL